MKSRKALVIVGALTLVAVAIVATGCVRKPLPESMQIDTRPFQIETGSSTGGVGAQTTQQDFALEGATEAKVELNMGAGEMVVRGAQTEGDLAQATFEYGASGEPKATYNVSGSTGQLTISQPDIRLKFGESNPNAWDIGLNQQVPLDLTVHLGAGRAQLDLSKVAVRELAMRLGAGETTVDLTGPRESDVTGDIQAGIGELKLVLPTDVGVKVTGAKDGVGDLSADGFTVQGDSYVNDAWGKTPTSIELRVMRGVGEVKLELQ